jgi:hypothetical protein
MLLFSINRSRGYENPSLDIIVIELCSIGGCPLEEANKCIFCIISGRLLGFIVSNKGIMVDPLKVEAIVQFPPSCNI